MNLPLLALVSRMLQVIGRIPEKLAKEGAVLDALRTLSRVTWFA